MPDRLYDAAVASSGFHAQSGASGQLHVFVPLVYRRAKQ